jgi:outer membrane protein OmpA-like peptidoglycan-associated protein
VWLKGSPYEQKRGFRIQEQEILTAISYTEGAMAFKRVASLVCILTLICVVASCAGKKKRTAIGAGTGAAAGAGIGAVIGHQSGNAGTGAVIGAATGALVGGGIGYYMDKQAEELERIEALEEVRREGDRIVATMGEKLLFEVDSAILKPTAIDGLTEVAGVLNRYPETKIMVRGYTDSTGSEAYNQELSERRAQSVGNFLISKGVDATRITMLGFGEQFPVASNDTTEGRQKNRRVELEITALETQQE